MDIGKLGLFAGINLTVGGVVTAVNKLAAVAGSLMPLLSVLAVAVQIVVGVITIYHLLKNKKNTPKDES